MSNKHLYTAKTAKNDEFYTGYKYILYEIMHYPNQFRNKVVGCICDDYRISNFVKVFKDYFHELGLAGLVATNYNIGQGAYKYTYNGVTETITPLESNGDFQSQEVIDIIADCDIVVTNPPFSLFRKFISLLMDMGKEFLVIAQPNAATYNVMFNLIQRNEIHTGATMFNGKMDFVVPDNYLDYKKKDSNGNKIVPVTICWWTNLKSDIEVKPLELKKKYNPNDYPSYDNVNAIEVSKVADIPCDYYGLMGVPPTFVDKYDPNQFEIVAKGSFYLNGEKTGQRYLIKRIKTIRKANRIERQVRLTIYIQFSSYNYQSVSNYNYRLNNAEHIPRCMSIEHLFLRGSPMLSTQKKEAA